MQTLKIVEQPRAFNDSGLFFPYITLELLLATLFEYPRKPHSSQTTSKIQKSICKKCNFKLTLPHS